MTERMQLHTPPAEPNITRLKSEDHSNVQQPTAVVAMDRQVIDLTDATQPAALHTAAKSEPAPPVLQVPQASNAQSLSDPHQNNSFRDLNALVRLCFLSV